MKIKALLYLSFVLAAVARAGLPDLPEATIERGGVTFDFASISEQRFASANDETARWQAAIDSAAAAGGGRVVIPAGEHPVGGLELKSNVELHLEKGATLLAAVGLDNYRIVKCPYSEGDWSAIVMGLNITNAAVTGEGVIHGRGKSAAPNLI